MAELDDGGARQDAADVTAAENTHTDKVVASETDAKPNLAAQIAAFHEDNEKHSKGDKIGAPLMVSGSDRKSEMIGYVLPAAAGANDHTAIVLLDTGDAFTVTKPLGDENDSLKIALEFHNPWVHEFSGGPGNDLRKAFVDNIRRAPQDMGISKIVTDGGRSIANAETVAKAVVTSLKEARAAVDSRREGGPARQKIADTAEVALRLAVEPGQPLV